MFRFIAILTMFMATLHTFSTVCGAENRFSEYEVKAGFIYNFIKFIEWPGEKETPARKILTIGVIGSDFPDKALEQIDGKIVRGLKLEVKRVGLSKELRSCNILFVGTSEKENLTNILNLVRNTGVLTIGDTEGFAQEGIILNFYIDRDRVRFEINTEKAKQANLNISSKLLKLARIVSTRKGD